MIDWDRASAFEVRLITQIARRAVREVDQVHGDGTARDMVDVEMDITACHVSGCPLDLNKLLNARAFDFAHDIAGIARHIDRNTGELRDCFVPRCALPTELDQEAAQAGE